MAESNSPATLNMNSLPTVRIDLSVPPLDRIIEGRNMGYAVCLINEYKLLYNI